MSLYELDKKTMISNIKKEYSDRYFQLDWIKQETVNQNETIRNQLLHNIQKLGASWSFGNTKINTNNLSPGCKLCGTGQWSCVFINGVCNGACFYCPTAQSSNDLPQTNTITFNSSKAYLEYLEHFSFKGASISGGEPLLTWERTLKYVKEIKRKFASSMYLWMYTNGILLTSEKAKMLADAGLDEIRLDIGATEYKLDAVRKVAGIIPTITVEIPAVPEERKTLESKMHEMQALGVKHLNLHQMRLTPYNIEKLLPHAYTYLHGPKACVLESEITALQLMHYQLENKIDIGINYCSFIYKNRYQRGAGRKRCAEIIALPYETITANGYIRRMYITAKNSVLEEIKSQLKQRIESNNWVALKDKIFLNDKAFVAIRRTDYELCLSYDLATFMPHISYQNSFKKITLHSGQSVIIEKAKIRKDYVLKESQVEMFRKRYIENKETNRKRIIPEKSSLFEQLDCMEFIIDDLLPYF